MPFTIQGQFSFTVFSSQAFTYVRPRGDRSSRPTTNVKVVQVRFNKSKIDIYVAQLAKAILGNITAEIDYDKEIKQDTKACLGVYIIQKLPMVTYMKMRNFSIKTIPKQASRQVKIIKDLIKY